MRTETVDVLVIGAGPSGSVASAYLFNRGLQVKVVEKSKFPRFVIGESLLPRCMDHFEEVGLLDCLKAQNFEVKSGARFIKDGKVCLFDFSKKHGNGWDWTWQVPRADFDLALTDELVNRGVDIAFEEEVVSVTFDDYGNSTTTIEVKNSGTYRIKAKFIIDSSGFGRVLPRILNMESQNVATENSSFFAHFEDKRRPEGEEGTLITFDIISDDHWLWFIPFSNGNTSIGLVGPTESFSKLKGNSLDKLQNYLKQSESFYQRFKNQRALFEPIEIKNISKSVTSLYGKGFALTGNSAEFLDPVFSSGVTFATESGLMAAKLVAKELAGEHVDWQCEYKEYMEKGVGVFRTYVKEWYTCNLQKIFFHDTINPDIKRQICAVLAGYVWDDSNPFVKNHHRLVKTLAHVVDMENLK